MKNKLTHDGGPFIRLRSQIPFHFNDPRPEDIRLGDMHHALSLINRWTGHAPLPIPVALHLVMGSRLVEEALRESEGDQGAWHAARSFFMHDGHEAYTGDISRPMKILLGYDAVKTIEKRIDRVIELRFDVNLTTPHPIVKLTDDRLLATEGLLFFPDTYEPDVDVEPYQADSWITKALLAPWPWDVVRERYGRRAAALGFSGP